MALPPSSIPPIEVEKLRELFARGEELGLRMEATDSGIVWESMPGLRHQELAVAIFGAIQPGAAGGDCEYYRVLDIYVRFPSGIVKGPDVSIFCRRPLDEEGFVHEVPEAVIEITSPESKGKDLVSGPPLYLANGVKDVVVLHRSKDLVVHWTVAGSRSLSSPATIALMCGCVATV